MHNPRRFSSFRNCSSHWIATTIGINYSWTSPTGNKLFHTPNKGTCLQIAQQFQEGIKIVQSWFWPCCADHTTNNHCFDIRFCWLDSLTTSLELQELDLLTILDQWLERYLQPEIWSQTWPASPSLFTQAKSAQSVNHDINNKGAPDSDFYCPAGYRICWISEKNPVGYRIVLQSIWKLERLQERIIIYWPYVKLFVNWKHI